MKNTTVVVFETIERPDYRQDLFGLDHIRSHFQFRFMTDDQGEVVVQYRKRSSDAVSVEGDQWREERFNAKKTVSRKARKKVPTPRDIKHINNNNNDIPGGRAAAAPPAAAQSSATEQQGAAVGCQARSRKRKEEDQEKNQ